MSNKNTTPPIKESREDLRAASLSKAIDAIGQASFLPNLLDYLRVDVPFVGTLLLLLDKQNRPHHIYDTIRTSFRINLDMYLDGVYQLDPFYTRFQKHKSTSAMLIRDVAPDRFQLTEYYRRYYRNIELAMSWQFSLICAMADTRSFRSDVAVPDGSDVCSRPVFETC